MANNQIITITDLHLYYGKVEALKGINMSIARNEVTSFIGPSGCGKSTLLRCINRMNDLIDNCVVQGNIYINGIHGLDGNIYDKNVDINALRKHIGMVFQKPNVFPMSIYDNIAFGPRTHGVKKRSDLDIIVEDSLKKAGIWNETKDNLKKSAVSLSGGQQQRICIARALAVQPKVLLMDEPTSALDPLSTATIEELCENLKEQYTIVIVTHNMQQATRISDKTAFFLLGEILEFGTTEQVFQTPRNIQCENYITGRFG
ncbi:MAG: phosphate ABC transporter ATP-binding protein PstB [Firmicutes bacterium]|nr:phosphate ABC transporter ATP-binding protein PstB [Bacillota bacterium]MCL1954143.1 phosphate ABC transporter ATP-binding protein PstB [Bacillota bacterium]